MLLQINVNASSSPDVIMKPDALNGTAEMIADFFVQLPNKTLHYICTLQYVRTNRIIDLPTRDPDQNLNQCGLE